jgi:hypothetical protein
MTRVSAIGPDVVPASQSALTENFYEGVRLKGPDDEKLIHLVDRILHYCAVARLRTHPVTITKAEITLNAPGLTQRVSWVIGQA